MISTATIGQTAAAFAFACTITSATASAQNASYTYFGTTANQNCSPAQPAVTHRHVDLPRLGSNFTVEVRASNGTCSYLCHQYFLLTGFSTTSSGPIALPAALGCGQVLVSADVPVTVPFGATANARISLPIPNNPAFSGVVFYQQAVAVTLVFGSVNTIAPGNAGRAVVGL